MLDYWLRARQVFWLIRLFSDTFPNISTFSGMKKPKALMDIQLRVQLRIRTWFPFTNRQRQLAVTPFRHKAT